MDTPGGERRELPAEDGHRCAETDITINIKELTSKPVVQVLNVVVL